MVDFPPHYILRDYFKHFQYYFLFDSYVESNL